MKITKICYDIKKITLEMNKLQTFFKYFIPIFFLIGFIIYGASLFNHFVWDDEEQILNNGLVHSITNLPRFFQGSTFNTGGTGSLTGIYYKPLMTVFFTLLYTIFGANPFFFHLFQLVFHLTNTCLIFVLFRKIFPQNKKSSQILAFFLSLVFLIHPINVETVVYSSSLQDILYMFFGLISLLFLIKGRLSLKRALTLSFLLLLSLLSKETGIIFILVSIIYIYLYQKEKLKSLIGSVFITLIAYSILRFGIAQVFFNNQGLSPITRIPFLERLLSIPKIITFYLTTFIFPAHLSISQHWVVKSFTFTDFYKPLIIFLITFLALTIYQYRLYRSKNSLSKLFLFFYCWFIFGLGLHLQIFSLDMTVADRWFYMAEVGLLGMAGVLILNLKTVISKFSLFLFILAAIIITALSIRTISRSLDWKNGLTLYSKDERITLNSFDLENNLGVELYRAGRFQEAKIHFEKSVEVAPFWWTNWNNLGAIYEQEKDIKRAKEAYLTAIKNGQYYLSYENVAKITFFGENNPKEAKKFVEDSLRFLPQNSTLWLILALSDYKLNIKDEALSAAKNAYILAPSNQTYYVVTKIQAGQPIDFGTQPN
ncbi:MAG: hypothetical protein NTV24_02900 [Candidatus Woesebacteria bacterium]|nr:hypothetical protein [Candidatus Woesebacteria bacterium]